MSLPLRLLGPRVLIQVDYEPQTVEQSAGGVFLAKTLEAAVEGSDPRESWYEGTVVAMGDDTFDVRPYVLRRLNELAEQCDFLLRITDCEARPLEAREHQGIAQSNLRNVIAEVEALPTTKPREFTIGDRVTFSHVAGEQIDIDGHRYLILKEDEILGVLEEYAV